jgi:hypothetical protein
MGESRTRTKSLDQLKTKESDAWPPMPISRLNLRLNDDSGATSHMCCDRKLFKTLRETSNELAVTIGDGRSLKATGTGNVVLRMNSGRGRRQVKLTLHDVLLVPGLARNLFSVTKATKMGKTLDFTEQECLVKEVRSNHVVARGHRQGGILPMSAQCHTQCTPGFSRAVAPKVWSPW